MKKKIREELLKNLKMCGINPNQEEAHNNAEKILLQILGDEEVTMIWNKIRRNFYYI
jgi:hypothetical protein